MQFNFKKHKKETILYNKEHSLMNLYIINYGNLYDKSSISYYEYTCIIFFYLFFLYPLIPNISITPNTLYVTIYHHVVDNTIALFSFP